jgi:hypothetical protein
MGKTVQLLPGQTLLDIAIQEYGTVEGLFEMRKLNSFTDYSTIPTSVLVHENPTVGDAAIREYYQDKGIKVVSTDNLQNTTQYLPPPVIDGESNGEES